MVYLVTSYVEVLDSLSDDRSKLPQNSILEHNALKFPGDVPPDPIAAHADCPLCNIISML